MTGDEKHKRILEASRNGRKYNRSSNSTRQQTTNKVNDILEIEQLLIQKLKSLEMSENITFVDIAQLDKLSLGSHKSLPLPASLLANLGQLSKSLKKDKQNCLIELKIIGYKDIEIQPNDFLAGKGLKPSNNPLFAEEKKASMKYVISKPKISIYGVQKKKYVKDVSLNFVDPKEICISPTDEQQVCIEAENHAAGRTFTLIAVMSKKLTVETLAEALREIGVKDVEITYTTVFPSDCRMFLLLPVYKGGHFDREDWQESIAVRIVAFKEAKTDEERN